MDPLEIAGGLGKLVDALLVDRDPVRHADFLTDGAAHLARFFEADGFFHLSAPWRVVVRRSAARGEVCPLRRPCPLSVISGQNDNSPHVCFTPSGIFDWRYCFWPVYVRPGLPASVASSPKNIRSILLSASAFSQAKQGREVE